MGFDKDFVWGVATASYQIEGAAFEDGKGLNIWDVFSHDEGRVYDNNNGDVACDHYHRVDEDIALMKKMGVKAYRFSISWSRLIPDGFGEVNSKGIDFYNSLIDKLIANGIEPVITLFHWDLPYEIHKKGGWLNRDIVGWFGNFTMVIAENFSDRVKKFITINEPNCFCGLGYEKALHAPGLKTTLLDNFYICHNALLAHGEAVRVLRQYSRQKVDIGITLATSPSMPYSESDADIEAARYVYENPDANSYHFSDTFWLDPIFFGKYPDTIEKLQKDTWFSVEKGDFELIGSKIDFIGTNIYSGNYFKAGKDGKPEYVNNKVGHARTALNWSITPQALYYGPKNLYERYGLPVYITENGMSAHDVVSLDGKVHDPNRIDYLQRYLLNLQKAVDSGIDVRGYFAWSLMDNFEWAEGYKDRFGLIYVDYLTQERILKDSAYWYKKVIETNGESLKNI